jgi:hypothetical protein
MQASFRQCSMQLLLLLPGTATVEYVNDLVLPDLEVN